MSTETSPPPSPPPFTLDIPTILSLGLVFALLPIAQGLARLSLPRDNRSYKLSRTSYYLFVWCAFDVLTHSIVEGSYLYHCFSSYTVLPVAQTQTHTADHPHPASLGANRVGYRDAASRIHPGSFLGRDDRLYGAWYSSTPMARLWQEYAKADRRWGGADLTIISLELLTVLGAGPLAAYVAYALSKVEGARARGAVATATASVWRAKMYFVAVVLSTAELYGGFITFAPEWLSGNTLLDGKDDPVYLWLYLVFFNVLWVFIPLWVLWVAWNGLIEGFTSGAGDGKGKGKKSL